MLPIRFLPEAKAEFDAAADWYEQRRRGLGVQFISRIGEVLKRIATNPKLHGCVQGNVRKAVVTKFPYIVLYQEESGAVLVVAVFHTSRNPGIWQGRINKP